MSVRDLEMTVNLPEAGGGEKVDLHMDSIGLRIENCYGKTLIPWADFDRVAAEVARYRKAVEAANG